MESPVATENPLFPDLHEWVLKQRSIPESELIDACVPPEDVANVILVTRTKAFYYNRQRLIEKAPRFAETYLRDLSDDTVDVINDCPIVHLDDSYEHNAGYIFCFLKALMSDDPSPYPLQSKRNFRFLSSVLCLFKRYDMEEMRVKALKVLESLYPADFDSWNEARKLMRQNEWMPDHKEVINLARWIEAWSILPSAMACLVNDMSAQEVYGVRFDDQDNIPQPQEINSDDAPRFAVLKEHSHISTRKMLLWMKTLGEGCNNVPEWIPSTPGRAPVGALKPKPGQCNMAFKATASRLLDEVYLVQPRGYADFYDLVVKEPVDRSRVCKSCRQKFEEGHVEMRNKWWEAVPKVMGFSGWEDERLWPAEYHAPAGDPPGEPYSGEGRMDPEGVLLHN